VQIDTFSSPDQTRFFCPFFPAITHLKMPTINGGHLAGTPSCRQRTLAVNIPYRGSTGPLHLLIDSTGIKVEGDGAGL
jgi:hypothetical protein